MDVELKIIQSEKADKPILFLVLPSREMAHNEIKQEIDAYLGEHINSVAPRDEYSLKNESLGEYLRNVVGSNYIYLVDGTDDNPNGASEFEGCDWPDYVIPGIISTYDGFEDVENALFHSALNNRAFATVLGAAAYLGGTIKTIGSSMVGIYYKRRGLCWINYPNPDIKMYLRKGMYDNSRVIYSEKMESLDITAIKSNQVRSTTFGNYPYFLLDMDEIEDTIHAMDLIKDAIKIADGE